MITFKNNVSYDDKVNKEDKEEETKREKKYEGWREGIHCIWKRDTDRLIDIGWCNIER